MYRSNRCNGVTGALPVPARPVATTTTKGNILNELLQLAHVENLLDETTEKGFLEERELESFLLEHHLAAEDVDELRRTLGERDVELRVENDDDSPVAPTPQTPAVTTDSLQL